MKALKNRGFRVVAGVGVLAAPIGASAASLAAATPANADIPVSAQTAGTFVGDPQTISETINGVQSVYGTLQVSATVDGSGHITDVTFPVSPPGAGVIDAATAAVAAANTRVSKANAVAASARARRVATAAAAARARVAVAKAKGSSNKKRAQLAAAKATAIAAAAVRSMNSANAAVATAKRLLATAVGELAAHNTSLGINDWHLPRLHDDALYTNVGRPDFAITEANVLATAQISHMSGASATEDGFRKSLQSALHQAGV